MLTGDLNDVGAAIRTNVPVSYRLGIELDGKVRLHEKWFVGGNLNLSRNKIRAFEEIIIDYTNGFERIAIVHDNTDIAFSPAVNTALQLMFIPVRGLEAELSTRYVGRQFLDNTSNLRRSIAPYHFQNVRLGWQFTLLGADARATLMVNNVLDRLYETNGYTYSYIFGELITENFYYPQAGRNWMLGLLIRI
ncbi:MAG: TonB-dependent receptor [Saprospiraceae bacterium]|nr:TonB-dependent receptor [Saprospiraceae bacterium]